jgi:hypothetical protein
MRCEPWTIAKVTVKGINYYELWHDKQPASVGCWGVYPSFDVAKHAAQEAEAEGRA